MEATNTTAKPWQSFKRQNAERLTTPEIPAPAAPLETALDAFLAHLGTDLEPHERWSYREAMRRAIRAYVGAAQQESDLLEASRELMEQSDRLPTYPVGLANAINRACDLLRKAAVQGVGAV